MTFKKMSTVEKMRYGKQFSRSQRMSYQKGKRNGWLECYHSSKRCDNKQNKQDFMQHSYTKDELNNLFDDIDKVKLY